MVNLSPERVHSICLWSKSFANVLKNPGHLSLYNLYFQFTITGYSKFLEPNVVDTNSTKTDGAIGRKVFSTTNKLEI